MKVVVNKPLGGLIENLRYNELSFVGSLQSSIFVGALVLGLQVYTKHCSTVQGACPKSHPWLEKYFANYSRGTFLF